jgi:hypothetical protein
MIRLDWIGMKYYHKRAFILPIIACAVSLLYPIAAIPYMVFGMLSFSVNPFAVEEKGKLDQLYLTLPVKRRTIVRARFALSILMVASGLIFGVLITLFLTALAGIMPLPVLHSMDLTFQNLLLLFCASLFMYAILNLSMFPFLFKIGYVKGKVVGFYLPIIAFMIIFYVVFMLAIFTPSFSHFMMQGLQWVFQHILLISLLMMGAAAALLLLSYNLSLHLYRKREF